MSDVKTRLLDAALPHVPFDGWSEGTFRLAVTDASLTPAQARAICPRGAVDLALAFHDRGDTQMIARLKAANLEDMRFRDRVAFAVRTRLEIAEEDKEAVRRGVTLFALPIHAADGAKAIWGTADAIWDTLGDTSSDVNWYTKRAILSGVYSSTTLFWLGDESEDHADTWGFLDRRIANVMQFEKVKSRAKDSPVLQRLMVGPNALLSRIRAPAKMPRGDLPGWWREPPARER
ncbi:MAG: COQ9 family protein [Pseudomonadota bacterium]